MCSCLSVFFVCLSGRLAIKDLFCVYVPQKSSAAGECVPVCLSVCLSVWLAGWRLAIKVCLYVPQKTFAAGECVSGLSKCLNGHICVHTCTCTRVFVCARAHICMHLLFYANQNMFIEACFLFVYEHVTNTQCSYVHSVLRPHTPQSVEPATDTQQQTPTYTHTLSLSLVHILLHALTHIYSHTHSLSHVHKRAQTLSRIYSDTHSLSAHTHTHILTHPYTHTLSYS